MHTDEEKRYDKRTIEGNLRQGVMSHQEFQEYLTNLPDVSHKAFCWKEGDKDLGTGRKKRKGRSVREA
ncbi:MAG: hypothetical protein GTN74_00050 [Proteobacteria bacterium]|nr:hypothetical protein [Pseudomonadota bacterium]NIS70149.1 hypothetical protein [Pseudomonadota bacterium]